MGISFMVRNNTNFISLRVHFKVPNIKNRLFSLRLKRKTKHIFTGALLFSVEISVDFLFLHRLEESSSDGITSFLSFGKYPNIRAGMSLVQSMMALVTVSVGAVFIVHFTDFRSPAVKEIHAGYLERDVKKALAEHRERKRIAKGKDSEIPV